MKVMIPYRICSSAWTLLSDETSLSSRWCITLHQNTQLHSNQPIQQSPRIMTTPTPASLDSLSEAGPHPPLLTPVSPAWHVPVPAGSPERPCWCLPSSPACISSGTIAVLHTFHSTPTNSKTKAKVQFLVKQSNARTNMCTSIVLAD